MGRTMDVEQPHAYAPNNNNYNPPPQTVPVYVVNGASTNQQPLACGGLGLGWTFFIIGFFITIPWYIGAGMLFCSKDEPREKPGFTACLIAAILATLLIFVWIIAAAAA